MESSGRSDFDIHYDSSEYKKKIHSSFHCIGKKLGEEVR